jgi:hypothetical protein
MLPGAPVRSGTFNVKDFEDFAAHDGLQLITSSR